MALSVECYRMRIGCFQPIYALVHEPKVNSFDLNAELTFVVITVFSISTTSFMSSTTIDKNMLISHWQP